MLNQHYTRKATSIAGYSSYRLAWARTYLKKAGYLENSSRGVWALTEKAKKADTIDNREIVNYVRSLSRPTETDDTSPEDPTSAVDDLPEETLAWRERKSVAVYPKTGIFDIVANVCSTFGDGDKSEGNPGLLFMVDYAPATIYIESLKNAFDY